MREPGMEEGRTDVVNNPSTHISGLSAQERTQYGYIWDLGTTTWVRS